MATSTDFFMRLRALDIIRGGKRDSGTFISTVIDDCARILNKPELHQPDDLLNRVKLAALASIESLEVDQLPALLADLDTSVECLVAAQSEDGSKMVSVTSRLTDIRNLAAAVVSIRSKG